MRFGEQLRSLRNQHHLTQPQLAAKAGIDQAYLSKLENGHSYPSSEVYQQLLHGLSVDNETFLEPLDWIHVSADLGHISLIEEWLMKAEKSNDKDNKRWFLMSSIAVILGVIMLYTGTTKVLFPELYYRYESKGIIKEGEPKEMLSNWQLSLPSGPEKAQERAFLLLEFESRMVLDVSLQAEYRGDEYLESVEGGYRLYQWRGRAERPCTINGLMSIFGIFLFSAGALGIYFDRRLTQVGQLALSSSESRSPSSR